VLETIAYLGYLVPVLTAFLWPARRDPPSRAGAVPGASPNAESPDMENPQHVPA
jgi:high-affinity iron transporter